MAQHRTREDKVKAQVRRSAHHYSLSELQSIDKKATDTTKQQPPSTGPQALPRKPVELVSTQHLSQDLLRTAFAFGIVLVSIAIAYWRLQ